MSLVAGQATFRFIDLFAGVGGFHHALEALGGTCVLASEIDPECRAVYRNSFSALPEERLVADVRVITRKANADPKSLRAVAKAVPDHEVLCAGFPCQPFSKSGQQLGLRDVTRGTYFFDVMSIVLAKRPEVVLLENVRNLAGPRHVETWAVMINSLADAGYDISFEPMVLSPHRLPPHMGGSPQFRPRVFLVATRADLERDPNVTADNMRQLQTWPADAWDLTELLQDDKDIHRVERFRLSAEECTWLHAWETLMASLPVDAIPAFPLWADAFVARPVIPADTPAWKSSFIRKNSQFFRDHKAVIGPWLRCSWGSPGASLKLADFPTSRRKFEWQARSTQPTRESRDFSELLAQFRPSGIRLKPATYSPALVAMNQAPIILGRRRRITPVEAARLQGLPDNTFALVSNSAAYKQAGNAVHVGVATALASDVLAHVGLLSRPAFTSVEEGPNGQRRLPVVTSAP